eukprot:CAMPEP_0201490790 /NCGR_PEP_ID=MMETSP0151_2-20130828/27500_1 /ASSEMBLY_ACC=CAM_ASM_000257 /TAXON_ID=200890 /ORGANISM="Paramoeba atlantica, Strain 621/1 / CCAP 1560/9" /LENGTH=449 /DNA_ID=CAMNT_0047876887 /DNA_START=54 /DNA_END=1403 /DNA_ORIENTATION=-
MADNKGKGRERAPSMVLFEKHQSAWTPKTLGNQIHRSPLSQCVFVEDRKQFLDISSHGVIEHKRRVTLEVAGPHERLYFKPKKTKVGIVTCGGLCPGLNNVIRGLVLCLWHRYGVRQLVGFRFGYEGLNPETSQLMELFPDPVRHIHKRGGTILGTSRGPQNPEVMAKFLIDKKIDILFTVGGDGTLRGAQKIAEAVEARGRPLAVVGVPKTIDNDISFTDKTFGFGTAVDVATNTISYIHNEAISHRGGVGIVKLMGRHSGFISLHASIASGDANLVLLPEVKFTWESLENYLYHRFIQLKKNDVVIVVAEGAGQDLLEKSNAEDPSGNTKLVDIGLAVKNFVNKYLKTLNIPFTIKYVDPSYTIRSAEANANDALYCIHLAQMACHAAMAGRTEIVVSQLHGNFVHIPIAKAIESRKEIDTKGWLYETLLDATGQPADMTALNFKIE